MMFVENPTFSTEDASKYFNRSKKKISTTLHKYGYHPYKILPVQKLTDEQKVSRLNFCRDMLQRKVRDNDFFKKVLWSDEATFTTAGMFNRRNSHLWALENPRGICEIKIQGRKAVHVWCGILDTQVIGPIFYEFNLNGERYLEFLENEIENYLENLPIRQYNDIIWHQDGAPPQNVLVVRNFLQNRYPLWIGRNGDIGWPPNSPDLTILDSFFWGYVKNTVYKERSASLEELKIKIINCISNLVQEKPHFIINAIDKIEDDYTKCVNNNGGHIEHL